MSNYAFTSLQNVGFIAMNTPPAPKVKRKWTGRPRGKTKEIQEGNIRKRISYLWLVEQAKYFRKQGILPDHIPCILIYIISMKRQCKGFPYYSNGYYAEQSVQVLAADILDYDKRQELGLN